MRSLPFDKPGRFYRGNLHTHSTHSDGVLDVPTVIAAYRDHGCVVEVDRGESWHITDTMAVAGRRLTVIATDDAHFKVEDYRGGWVQVKADRLDPDALLDALKTGHFYSSTGPELRDVRIDGGQLRVRCSKVRSIIATGRGARAVKIHSADGLESADLPLERFAGGYVRVTVVDTAGGRAWTNPIWLD